MFDWQDYFQLAKLLRQLAEAKDIPEFHRLNEASHRTVISRAYYAVFRLCLNRAREKADDLRLMSDKEDKIHAKTITYYLNSSNQAEQLIGQFLRNMRADRNSADYDDDLSGFPEPMSKVAINLAQKILDLLKKA